MGTARQSFGLFLKEVLDCGDRYLITAANEAPVTGAEPISAELLEAKIREHFLNTGGGLTTIYQVVPQRPPGFHRPHCRLDGEIATIDFVTFQMDGMLILMRTAGSRRPIGLPIADFYQRVTKI